MRSQARLARRWLLGYVAGLFTTLPLALPVWKRWLEPAVGRIVTVQDIHLAQYFGLGALAGWDAAMHRLSPRRIAATVSLLLAVGFLDESVQRWLPQRFFDWADVWLDWTGGLCGAALAGVGVWMRQRRVRAR